MGWEKIRLNYLNLKILNLAKLVQENFSIYLLVFFLNHSLNIYLFSQIKMWDGLIYVTLQIFLLSFLFSSLICEKNGYFRKLIIFSIIIFLIVIIVFLHVGDEKNLFDKMVINGGFLIGSSFLIGITLFFVNCKYLKLITLIILSLIWVIDVFTLIHYQTPINSTLIIFVLETNIREVIEYLYMNISLLTIFSILIFGYILKYLYFDSSISKKFVPMISKSIIIIIPLSIFFLFQSNFNTSYTNDYRVTIPIVRTLKSVNNAILVRDGYKKFISESKGKSSILANNSKIKNIVLVLGESASRNHLGIYGYRLNTTPYAKELEKLGYLRTFKDVISPFEATSAVMVRLFTFLNYENEENNEYEHENLIDVMKESGYKTYWISNQDYSGTFGNIEMILSERSDNKIFTRLRASEQLNLSAYDEELLPLIDKAQKEKEEKKFIVIHLLGSHCIYNQRYPQNYNKFNKDDISVNRTEEKKQIIAEYDNSILYTDYILNSIFKKFKEEDTLIIYLSDHGEDVFDTRDKIWRTNEKVNKHTVEVPFFILTNDIFNKKYPDKIDQIDKALTRPYMTDDFIHTILDLADIKTEKFEEKRSIINLNYDSTRKRIACGDDYDLELKDKD